MIDPSDKFCWLIQLDEGGITQWFDSLDNELEGYKRMTNTEVFSNSSKDVESATNRSALEVYEWIMT